MTRRNNATPAVAADGGRGLAPGSDKQQQSSTAGRQARLDYGGAAAYIGVKQTTLRSMVSRGQVPHIRLTPRLVVFDTEQLDAWLAEKAVVVGGRP